MTRLSVEDFVVLGRTVPEDSKTYGKRICMAGYSEECNQFLRVYPLFIPIGERSNLNWFKARYRYQLDLKRNPKDNRTESWRLLDEQRPTTTDWDGAQERKKEDVMAWLEKHAVPSIDALNKCKLSLGVLKIPAADWEGICIPKEEPNEDEQHKGLFDDLEDQATSGLNNDTIDPNKVNFAPYIKFTDDVGPHRLQVREWGAFRLMAQDKYKDDPEALWGASGYKRGRDMLIVVGNMTNHRKNWLVIKTFQYDEKKQERTLFDDLPQEPEEE